VSSTYILKDVNGVRKVTLSEVVSYALLDLMEKRERKKNLRAVAGAWADLDTEAMKKDIYESRINSDREIIF
jgi:hypothetical protein